MSDNSLERVHIVTDPTDPENPEVLVSRNGEGEVFVDTEAPAPPIRMDLLTTNELSTGVSILTRDPNTPTEIYSIQTDGPPPPVELNATRINVQRQEVSDFAEVLLADEDFFLEDYDEFGRLFRISASFDESYSSGSLYFGHSVFISGVAYQLSQSSGVLFVDEPYIITGSAYQLSEASGALKLINPYDLAGVVYQLSESSGTLLEKAKGVITGEAYDQSYATGTLFLTRRVELVGSASEETNAFGTLAVGKLDNICNPSIEVYKVKHAR